MELLFFAYIKILFLGIYSKTITFKNILMSLFPFGFLVFISFYNTTITYKFILYFLVLFLSSMSFIKNRFHAFNYVIFVIFIEIYVLFIVYGNRLFYLLFNVGEFDLLFFIVEILIVIFTIWIYIILSKLQFINKVSYDIIFKHSITLSYKLNFCFWLYFCFKFFFIFYNTRPVNFIKKLNIQLSWL